MSNNCRSRVPLCCIYKSIRSYYLQDHRETGNTGYLLESSVDTANTRTFASPEAQTSSGASGVTPRHEEKNDERQHRQATCCHINAFRQRNMKAELNNPRSYYTNTSQIIVLRRERCNFLWTRVPKPIWRCPGFAVSIVKAMQIISHPFSNTFDSQLS